MRKIKMKLAALPLLMAASFGAHAGLVTLNGSTVSFTYDDALLGLYGTASVVGDSFNLTHSNLFVQANDLSTFGSADASLLLHVSTLNGSSMNEINTTQSGGYVNPGVDNYVSAGADVLLYDTNNALNESGYFVEPAASLAGQYSSLPINWTAYGFADVSSFASSSFDVDLYSYLVAVSGGVGDQVSVLMSQVVIGVTTAPAPVVQPVPLPGATWLFLAGLMGVLGVSKRHASKLFA